jgi:hypothetical protein
MTASQDSGGFVKMLCYVVILTITDFGWSPKFKSTSLPPPLRSRTSLPAISYFPDCVAYPGSPTTFFSVS